MGARVEAGEDGAGALRSAPELPADRPQVRVQAVHGRLQAREQGVQGRGRAGEVVAHERLELPGPAVPGAPEAGRLGQPALDPEPLARAEPGRQLALEQAHGAVHPGRAGPEGKDEAAQQDQGAD